MSRTGFLTMEGLAPLGSGKVVFKFSTNTIDELQREGPAHRFHALKSAAQVLSSPTAIFEGLRREGHEGSFCYVGKPKKWTSEGCELPPPPGYVFVVFATTQHQVFGWRWERTAPDDEDLPEEYPTRFERLLWKLHS